jgi:uncharacterized membrane protein YjjP (DUF1212 family)
MNKFSIGFTIGIISTIACIVAGKVLTRAIEDKVKDELSFYDEDSIEYYN